MPPEPSRLATPPQRPLHPVDVPGLPHLKRPAPGAPVRNSQAPRPARRVVKVALHAAQPRLGNVAANVEAVAEALAARNADLHVFPEMFLTGYNIGDDVQRLAFDDQDERLTPVCEAAKAHGAHLIVGAPRRVRTGITRNAAACIDPEGDVTWIDKRVLPTFTTFREGLFFGPGEEQPVWRTRLGNIGVGICYDLYFPEFHKTQVLAGADVLVNISASPSSSRRFFEALLPARAIENAAFMLYSNNVGAQDGLVFWGGSAGFGPRGEFLAQQTPYQPGHVIAEVDLSDLQAAREFRPTIRDSRA